jgi:hypothetical protein
VHAADEVLESILIARASLYMFNGESFPVQAPVREKPFLDVVPLSEWPRPGRLRLVGSEFKSAAWTGYETPIFGASQFPFSSYFDSGAPGVSCRRANQAR